MSDAKQPVRRTPWFDDVVSYASDQAREFRLCAGHYGDRNRGAEAVALRAAEILDRIIADIRSPNAVVSDGGTPFAPRPGSKGNV